MFAKLELDALFTKIAEMNWSHCVKEPDVSDAQKIPTLLGWTCLHDVSIISRLLTGKRVSPAKKVENKIDISRQ